MDLSALYSIENGALLNWAALFALGLGDVIALDFMERVFAAKNPKVARRGALWGRRLDIVHSNSYKHVGNGCNVLSAFT